MAILLLAAGLGGCRQDMHDQPVYEALEASAFFADGRASRPPVEGTVARDALPADALELTGKHDGAFVARAPIALDAAVLARGRERYDVFCSPCHDRVGTGEGMIVQRGYRRPPSLHEARLRDAADGYLFDVITNGFGVMPSYGPQIPPRDRWAIVGYVRALQLSQNAPASLLTAEERARLAGGAVP
ncbi:MAG TPA: cytochrome c [Candidatus Limnocylindria bacterium]|nr:cytochrome c [Candidatus Limnocylindria bacterium]